MVYVRFTRDVSLGRVKKSPVVSRQKVRIHLHRIFFRTGFPPSSGSRADHPKAWLRFDLWDLRSGTIHQLRPWGLTSPTNPRQLRSQINPSLISRYTISFNGTSHSMDRWQQGNQDAAFHFRCIRTPMLQRPHTGGFPIKAEALASTSLSFRILTLPQYFENESFRFR